MRPVLDLHDQLLTSARASTTKAEVIRISPLHAVQIAPRLADRFHNGHYANRARFDHQRLVCTSTPWVAGVRTHLPATGAPSLRSDAHASVSRKDGVRKEIARVQNFVRNFSAPEEVAGVGICQMPLKVISYRTAVVGRNAVPTLLYPTATRSLNSNEDCVGRRSQSVPRIGSPG
jgi:hypothetical protein